MKSGLQSSTNEFKIRGIIGLPWSGSGIEASNRMDTARSRHLTASRREESIHAARGFASAVSIPEARPQNEEVPC